MTTEPPNEPTKAQLEQIKMLSERADETACRVYVAQFMDQAVTFLLREHMEANGPEKIEALIQGWRESLGKIIGETIQNDGLDKILGKAGLTTDAEMHQRADQLMHEAEEAIRMSLFKTDNATED